MGDGGRGGGGVAARALRDSCGRNSSCLVEAQRQASAVQAAVFASSRGSSAVSSAPASRCDLGIISDYVSSTYKDRPALPEIL